MVLLGGLALIKAFVDPDQPLAARGDLVRVEVWIPSDAQAQLGETFMANKGAVRVAPGPTVLELFFDDGKHLNCPFVASGGTSVRWVGSDSVSVDDGDAQSCTLVRPPRKSEG